MRGSHGRSAGAPGPPIELVGQIGCLVSGGEAPPSGKISARGEVVGLLQ